MVWERNSIFLQKILFFSMMVQPEDEMGEFPIASLPQLLKPKRAQFQESLCGIGVVLFMTGVRTLLRYKKPH